MKAKRNLVMRSTVSTLSIKCYDEQLADGWDKTQETIRDIAKDTYHVLAIKHDRDPKTDNIWESSLEKPHYHIIIRLLNKKRTKVQTILNMLKITYRPEVDDNLWQNHGVETIRNFPSMAMYLTHDTEEAILQGKEHYELDEVVSNLTTDEIKQVREGYQRFGVKKVDMSTMEDLEQIFLKMADNLEDIDEFYESLPLIVRKNSAMRTILDSYHRRVARVASQGRKINRVAVFIQGKPNIGKTYSAINCFPDSKKLIVDGGGTGKFDNLTVGTDVIIVDDHTAEDLLNMADNKICQMYKRQSNNPFWCGRYLIITSNLSFRQWVKACGIATRESVAGITKDTEQYKAIQSRFYTCHIDNQKLIVDTQCSRGTKEDQGERNNLFADFAQRYNTLLEQYHPSEVSTKEEASIPINTIPEEVSTPSKPEEPTHTPIISTHEKTTDGNINYFSMF